MERTSDVVLFARHADVSDTYAYGKLSWIQLENGTVRNARRGAQEGLTVCSRRNVRLLSTRGLQNPKS
jgi:hypothetical protein